MKFSHYLPGILWRTLATLLMLAGLIALFVAYRVISYEQQDGRERLQAKQEYLSALSNPGLLAMGQSTAARPNILLILFDDIGYGDIGPGVTDPTLINTPNIDSLAAQGIALTNFYSPAPTCTPARAAFLTGRLPLTAGMPYVVFPSGSIQETITAKLMNPEANLRLPQDEITLADVLGAVGYRTGMVGKWHLGDRSPSLPNDMGFEMFYGSLYSNDMKPFALYRDRDIAVSAPVDQRYLTEVYTEEVLSFLRLSEQDERPFFLYFAHNFPHDPLFAREEFQGLSDAGLYGDVLEEIDRSIGDILSALEEMDERDNTLIIISSDNGPWFLGDAGVQRGRKGNTFEGGMRVPFIANWPARIPPGLLSANIAMGTDLLPTILDFLDIPAPSDRVIDGVSLSGTLTAGALPTKRYLYYYEGKTLFAVRDERFKYRAPNGVLYSTDEMPFGLPIAQKEWLFDLERDPREAYDTSERYPDKLTELRSVFEQRQEMDKSNHRGWL